MSYCRWSCDNFHSDLYCYADVDGGYTTHIAGCKLRPEKKPGDVRWDAGAEVMEATHREAYEDIGLPHDGETFNDPDLQSFRKRVVDLLAMGYRAPPYLLERIDSEIAEESKPL